MTKETPGGVPSITISGHRHHLRGQLLNMMMLMVALIVLLLSPNSEGAVEGRNAECDAQCLTLLANRPKMINCLNMCNTQHTASAPDKAQYAPVRYRPIPQQAEQAPVRLVQQQAQQAPVRLVQQQVQQSLMPQQQAQQAPVRLVQQQAEQAPVRYTPPQQQKHNPQTKQQLIDTPQQLQYLQNQVQRLQQQIIKQQQHQFNYAQQQQQQQTPSLSSILRDNAIPFQTMPPTSMVMKDETQREVLTTMAQSPSSLGIGIGSGTDVSVQAVASSTTNEREPSSSSSSLSSSKFPLWPGISPENLLVDRKVLSTEKPPTTTTPSIINLSTYRPPPPPPPPPSSTIIHTINSMHPPRPPPPPATSITYPGISMHPPIPPPPPVTSIPYPGIDWSIHPSPDTSIPYPGLPIIPLPLPLPPPPTTTTSPKPYKYAYTIRDGFEDVYHSKYEQRHSNGQTDGSYSYLRPDGVWQTVDYLSNKFGFYPKVYLDSQPPPQLNRIAQDTAQVIMSQDGLPTVSWDVTPEDVARYVTPIEPIPIY